MLLLLLMFFWQGFRQLVVLLQCQIGKLRLGEVFCLLISCLMLMFWCGKMIGEVGVGLLLVVGKMIVLIIDMMIMWYLLLMLLIFLSVFYIMLLVGMVFLVIGLLFVIWFIVLLVFGLLFIMFDQVFEMLLNRLVFMLKFLVVFCLLCVYELGIEVLMMFLVVLYELMFCWLICWVVVWSVCIMLLQVGYRFWMVSLNLQFSVLELMLCNMVMNCFLLMNEKLFMNRLMLLQLVFQFGGVMVVSWQVLCGICMNRLFFVQRFIVWFCRMVGLVMLFWVFIELKSCCIDMVDEFVVIVMVKVKIVRCLSSMLVFFRSFGWVGCQLG